MEILLDTNFILACVKQKLDLFSQLRELFPRDEIIIPGAVIRELEMLSKRLDLSFKERNAASVAVQIVRKENVKIIDSEGKADNFIARYALKNGSIIATLDRTLKSRVRGGVFLTIRQGKKIAVL